MTRRDEFDDPEGFQSAFGKIAQAMEQGHSGLRRRGPMLGILTLTVALFVLFAVFWSTYPRGDKADEAGPVPMIRADATPFKTTPDNPGGMDIPYRDSTVFEALRDRRGEGKVESLLPPTEEPIPKEQMFAGLKTEPMTPENKDAATMPPEEELDSGPVKTSDSAEHQGTILSEKTPVPEKVEKTEPAAGDAKAMPEKVPEKSPEKSNVKPDPKSTGAYYIQLGSVKDRGSAESEWKALQKQFPAQLGDLRLRVEEANLGAKGRFYRIQGGAVAQADGKAICNAIAARRAGGCLVVAR